MGHNTSGYTTWIRNCNVALFSAVYIIPSPTSSSSTIIINFAVTCFAGSELSLGDEESCVPLMLILDDKSATLILPANWGLPFWVAFQYAGARPGRQNYSSLCLQYICNKKFTCCYYDVNVPTGKMSRALIFGKTDLP